MDDHFQHLTESINRRWRIIGRRLDHPLAEWYFEQHFTRHRFSLMKYLKPALLVVLVYFGFALFDIFVGLHRAPWIAAFLFLFLHFFQGHLIPPRTHPACLFNKRKPHLLHDVWLSGVNYSDLAAIAVMLKLYQNRGFFRRFIWHLLLNLLFITVVPIIFREYTGQISAWVLAISVMILMNTAIHTIFSPEQIAQQALREFRHITSVRAGSYDTRENTMAFGCATFVIASIAAMFCMMVYATLREAPWFLMIFAGSTCLIFAAALLHFDEKIQPGRTLFYYREICRIGQKEYARIAQTELEKPRP